MSKNFSERKEARGLQGNKYLVLEGWGSLLVKNLIPRRWAREVLKIHVCG